jgi:hypothetical protein
MDFDSILTWSYLDTKPVLAYSKSLDEYLVAWNGYPMTYEMAFAVAATAYFNVYLPAASQGDLLSKFMPIYRSYLKKNIGGRFQGENLLSYPSNYLHTILNATTNTKPKSDSINNRDVLGWFDTANAVEIN